MPGTYALAGDMTWTDYRISVRLRSDVAGAPGVMFRFQGQPNYQRFSVDLHQQAGGLGRLIKKVAGAVTLLWQHPGPYIQGRDYLLALDCVGERLAVYLNGTLVFVVHDSDLASGRIGLYVWRNTGARFAEV